MISAWGSPAGEVSGRQDGGPALFVRAETAEPRLGPNASVDQEGRRHQREHTHGCKMAAATNVATTLCGCRGTGASLVLLLRGRVDHMTAAMSQPNRRGRDSGIQRVEYAATALLFLVILAASPARAANREARERMARTACLAGDYGKGVTILSQLFVETKEPTWIYNQGRCFEQNARCQEAISRFQEFLRVGKHLSEEVKAETQKHISDCQASLQPSLAGLSAQPVMSAPLVQATPAAAPASAPPPPTAPVSVVGERSMPSDSSPAPGAGLRTAGVITAAVGGAALVTGLILNLKVNSMASDFQTLNGYTDSKESDRKT